MRARRGASGGAHARSRVRLVLVALVAALVGAVLAVGQAGFAPVPASAQAGAVPAPAVTPFGTAPALGAPGGPVTAPVVGMAATASGGGYWLVASDGGIFAFGDATFHGSTGGIRLNQPIVGMAGTPSGGGYWLVASDGGIFAFGDATFHGSTGATRLNQPIVAMATTDTGAGYWLLAADGGIFAFGDAAFHGAATAAVQGGDRAVAVAGVAGGYWVATARSTLHHFGPAPAVPAPAALRPVVGMAARPDGSGGWLASQGAAVAPVVTAPPPVTPATPSAGLAPAGSGSGRRIVFDNTRNRVWLVRADNTVEKTYLVSGRRNTPKPGTYRVYSKSPLAYAGHDGITMRHMVRFTRGADLAIGFHSIPLSRQGRPLQSERELGQFRSSGCIRQRNSDAEHLYEWAPIGTTVVVIR